MTTVDTDRDRGPAPRVDRYPEGLPLVVTDHLETVVRDALDEGVPPGRVYERLADERVRAFERDPTYRERVRAVLDAAGVTGLCATAIAFGAAESQGREAVTLALARFQACVDAADWLDKALDPEDFTTDGVRLFLAIEDTVALEGDADAVETFYDLGVRAIQLAYDGRNAVGGGHADRADPGLSRFGVSVVERMNDLGMVVDLSHCGERTTSDAIDCSAAPPAFTHVYCRSLRDDPRGKRDGEIRRLGEAGGYVGIMAVPPFVGERGGLEAVVDHVDRAVDLAGVDRVGVMTNWGIWTPEMPAALRDGLVGDPDSHMGSKGMDHRGGLGVPPMDTYEDWDRIPEALADRGYTRAEVEGLCGGHFVDYLRRVR